MENAQIDLKNVLEVLERADVAIAYWWNGIDAHECRGGNLTNFVADWETMLTQIRAAVKEQDEKPAFLRKIMD